MSDQDSDTLKNSVALCVLSYDGSEDLWAKFFDLFAEAWPDCPLEIYLLTNHKTYLGSGDVKTIAIGEDIDWSSNLLKALDRIPQDRVLFTFDDMFLRSVDDESVRYHLKEMVAKDWKYLTLYPNNHMREYVSEGVRRISDHGVYRCTLLFASFEKEALKQILVPGENAWEFEIEGGKRAGNIELYSIVKTVFRRYHMLRKGKWMRPGYDLYIKPNGLEAGRPVETRIEYLIRETKEWLFRRYHRIMPPFLIERFEKRRRPSS